MKTSALNEWLQIAAAVGVIFGLFLVAYEIGVSNRIGIEQANAASLDRHGEFLALLSTVDGGDLFVRAQEGEELSRSEMYRLDSLMNTFLGALYYDWTLAEAGTIEFEGGFAAFMTPAIQWYLGSPIGRRKWETDSGDWDTPFGEVVEDALSAQSPRDVLRELDYLRGAIESVQ